MKKRLEVILAVDPSGNFTEGKGTTGYAVLDFHNAEILEAKHITAVGHNCCFDYWNANLEYVLHTVPEHYDVKLVVIEGYVLYQNKAMGQVSSSLETPQFIGVLKYMLKANNIPFIIQLAMTVKRKWADEVLVANNILKKKGRGMVTCSRELPVNRHCKDAIRHGLHALKFNKKVKEIREWMKK